MSRIANNALLGGGLGFGLENKERSKEDHTKGTTKPLLAILDISHSRCIFITLEACLCHC